MSSGKTFIQKWQAFGCRQIPVWYDSSNSVTNDFQIIGKKLNIANLFPNPHPFYDWIMGFYERRSNRAALSSPMLENVKCIIDAGVGTGYLLGLVIQQTQNKPRVVAVDLSLQMLENAREYLVKHNLISEQVTFKQADCKQLPYDDQMFDLYISSYLLDLLAEEELYLALREMERVLEPGGQAILVTMTTELDEVWWPKRIFYRLMNEFYCLGYRHGRWNRIWKSLCAGYAPHCRPIALGNYLRDFPSLAIEYSKVSHVSLFPVRIYYVRKQYV